MKRLLVATAIAMLILALTATAALAHGRHAMHGMGCCEEECADACAQVAEGQRDAFEGDRFDHHQHHEVHGPAMRMVNPAVSETVSGSVMDVYQTASTQGQGTGLHLLLKTDGEMLDVHLGPEWYLDQQDFRVEPGDSLAIKGERFTKYGAPALIAFEMQKGEQVLSLRDQEGLPQWKGSPRA